MDKSSIKVDKNSEKGLVQPKNNIGAIGTSYHGPSGTPVMPWDPSASVGMTLKLSTRPKEREIPLLKYRREDTELNDKKAEGTSRSQRIVEIFRL